jgi:murein DD-endopeptidase MepM/ murein hydrolase activator NlpD
MYGIAGLNLSSGISIGVASIGYNLSAGVRIDKHGTYATASAGVYASAFGAVASFGAHYASLDGRINTGFDIGYDMGDLTPAQKQDMTLVEVEPDLLNPTGGEIRNDLAGAGEYGEPRISNPDTGHTGIDLLGGKVMAAHSGYLETLNRDGYNTGVRITGSVNGQTYSTIYQHIEVSISSGYVQKGTTIGTIKSHPTNSAITPHLHFEVYKINNGIETRVNPAKYIRIP